MAGGKKNQNDLAYDQDDSEIIGTLEDDSEEESSKGGSQTQTAGESNYKATDQGAAANKTYTGTDADLGDTDKKETAL